MTRRRTFRPSRWALILLIAAGLAVAADMYLPAGLFPAPEHRVILIQRGQTLREVSEELKRVGLLSGTLGFQVLARAMRLDRNIRAGQYSFQLGTPVPTLLRALARGMSGLNVVTIPEGLTTTEVSLLLSNHLGVPVAEFDSLSRDRAFLDSLGISAPSIEGYLAPDSYEFLPGTSPEVAFRTMAKRTLGILLQAAAGRDSLPLGLSLHQVLTLASIVEAEAGVDIERPRIASVYLNRLAMGMRLQADPTVGYAIGGRPRSRLLFRDLRVDSPFNTYLYQGLPPGPICNPGRASIAGVIDPLPGMKELYFVADGTGRHLFSRTYEEHMARIRQVRARVEIPPPELAPAPPATSKSAARVDTAVGAAGKTGAAARPTAVAAAKPEAPAVRKPAASAARKSATVETHRPDTNGTKSSGVKKKPGTVAAKKPAAAASKVAAGTP
jgi:peptidoglycan lytic transglycosylase G